MSVGKYLTSSGLTREIVVTLTDRKPPSTSRSVKAGDVFSAVVDGKRLSMTAVEFVEMRGQFSVWKFRCKCGNTVNRYAALVKHAARNASMNVPHRRSVLSCGCEKVIFKHGCSHTSAYRTWQLMKSRFCKEWKKDFVAFRDQCYALKNGRFLCRIRFDEPLGPNNFAWSNKTEATTKTIERVVSVLVSRGESEADARKRVGSISKQRQHQILKSENSHCCRCGNPRKFGDMFCYECQAVIDEKKNRPPGKRGSKRLSKWDKLCDGELHDIPVEVDSQSLQQSAYNAAKRRGGKVKTRSIGGRLFVQFTPNENGAP